MTAHDVILGPLWAVTDRPYRKLHGCDYLLQATEMRLTEAAGQRRSTVFTDFDLKTGSG